MRSRGFTLIELIMVMVMVGILAVYAVPRLFDRSVFDARGMHGMTMSYLRYAQKSAIAQRRQVCVAYTASSVTLTVAAASGTGICPAASSLSGPDGKPRLDAPAGVIFTPTPTAMGFDALGQPLDDTGTTLAAARTVVVAGAARTITVEAATGYVHD